MKPETINVGDSDHDDFQPIVNEDCMSSLNCNCADCEADKITGMTSAL